MNNAPATPPPSAVEKLDALLRDPQAQAILLAAEQRAADLINRLPAAGRTGLVPGWRTSEFWCLVVFSLLALTTTLSGALPAKYAVIAQAISVGLYQISRGLAKSGN